MCYTIVFWGEVKMKPKLFDGKIKKKDVFFNVCVAISFVLLCVSLYCCFFNSIIGDELYSIYMAKTSYVDIIINTILDVHPPLFYFILKFFTELFTTIFPFTNVVILSKLISFASIVILFYFLVFKFSKIVKKEVIGICLLMLFCFGVFNEYTITIRMYGYSMLFVTVALYYAIKIIKDNSKRDLKMFVLFFELSALSHYFALIAVVGILLLIMLYSVFFERKNFWLYYKYALYCVIFYVPWLVILCCQFAYLSSYGYWIPTLSSGSVYDIFYYVFSIKLVDGLNNKVCTMLLIAVYLVVLIINLLNKKISRVEKFTAVSGLFTVFFVIAVGLCISLITPIFISRYCLPSLFVTYFSIIYNFYLLFNYSIIPFVVKKIKNIYKYVLVACSVVFICLISIYGIFNVIKVIKHEAYLNKYYTKIESQIADFDEKIIIADHGSVQHPFEYQFGVTVSGLAGCDVSWWQNVTGVNHKVYSVSDIKNLLDDGEEVLLLLGKTSIDKYFADGISYELIDTIYMENFGYSVGKVNIYKAKLM